MSLPPLIQHLSKCFWFMPDKSFAMNIVRLWAYSLLATTFFLYAGYFTLPGGGWNFPAWAMAIHTGGHLDPSFVQRDAGYPILLWLSGYPLFGSFIGSALMQALFTLLMPIMAAYCIGRRYPRIAFWTGILVMLTLAPYQYMKWIHHDHAFVFFTLLTSLAAITALRTGKPWHIYLMTAVAIFMSITRPAGNLAFPGLLILLLCLRPQPWRHYVACAALFVSALMGYVHYRDVLFDIKDPSQRSSYAGAQFMYNFYMNTKEFGVEIDREASPHWREATDRLHTLLKPSLRESKAIRTWIGRQGTVSPQFAEEEFYRHSPDAFLARFLKEPNYEYYTMFYETLNDDALLLKAYKELVLQYPGYMTRIVMRNAGLFLATPGFTHTRGNTRPTHQEGLQLVIGGGSVHKPMGIPDKAVRELTHPPLGTDSETVKHILHFLQNNWLGGYYWQLTQWTLGFMLIGFAWGGLSLWARIPHFTKLRASVAAADPNGIGGAALLNAALLFYNVLVTSAFVDPNYRYHFFIISLQCVGAGFGVAVIRELFRHRFYSSLPVSTENVPVRCIQQCRWALLLLTVLLWGSWAVNLHQAAI